MNVRVSVSKSDAVSRHALVASILKLKSEGNPASGRNYDTFVRWQLSAFVHVHRGPGFLPWHRFLLSLFEKDLQDISSNPELTVPYWDWTDPAANIWTPDFLGGDGAGGDNRVATGPFCGDSNSWILKESDIGRTYLTRKFNRNKVGLPSRAAVAALQRLELYDTAGFNESADLTRSYRNSLEGFGGPKPRMHNQVQIWVGGEMDSMTAANDPAFWLHLANCDRLWAEWQDSDLSHGYLPLEPVSSRPGHSLFERLVQFPERTVAEVLDFRRLGYRYDTTAAESPLTESKLFADAFGVDRATAMTLEQVFAGDTDGAAAAAIRATSPFGSMPLDLRRAHAR